jgi:hypothetical protein
VDGLGQSLGFILRDHRSTEGLPDVPREIIEAAQRRLGYGCHDLSGEHSGPLCWDRFSQASDIDPYLFAWLTPHWERESFALFGMRKLSIDFDRPLKLALGGPFAFLDLQRRVFSVTNPPVLI